MSDLTKRVNGEMLYSSKLIELETGKVLKQIHRDVRKLVKLLGGTDLNHRVNTDSYIFNEETDARGYTTQYWMNRKAIELVTTGYDVVRRAMLLDKLEELYAENKRLKTHAVNTLDALPLISPEVTSRELLESWVFQGDWWEKFIMCDLHLRSSRLTYFLRKFGAPSHTIETGEYDWKGRRIRRAVFHRTSVFAAIDKALYTLVERDLMPISDHELVLEEVSGELRIGEVLVLKPHA